MNTTMARGKRLRLVPMDSPEGQRIVRERAVLNKRAKRYRDRSTLTTRRRPRPIGRHTRVEQGV